ncbi:MULTISPECIES: DUF6263 family protein [unclassified Nocardioides]|uniref:DUF6263 family protein n=1 Tax=unclassified Nocardioides TaxID=2615069 RepID=UPI0006FDB58C|nr:MULTISPECIES: DUF6263 family protein [unclassified Nocardioides]KRA32575.1 hypothetical protein ASD81_13620 [Nocardioides sp. Root614]KRA89228.1 hypothetical protein ASD84_13885 [Nocardioides sp. Root682]
MPVARPLLCRSLAAVVVAVLALSGCNDAETPKAEPSGPTTAATAATPSAVAPAVVTLVDAGASPRRVVELDVEKGHTESSTLELTSTTAVDLMSSPAITVPMTIPFTTTVADVTDDEVAVDVRYDKATVTGGGLQKDVLDQARKTVGYLEGVTARVVLNRSGTVVSRDVELGDAAPDLVGRILEDVVSQGFALAVAFPTEEIGVGARWTVASDLSIGGVRASVTSTYELSELTDTGYSVTVRATQVTQPGDTLAGKVIDGRSTSTGTVRGQAGLLGPVEARTSTQGSSTVEVGGQQVKTTFDITLRASTR